jgi:hypothetical protein
MLNPESCKKERSLPILRYYLPYFIEAFGIGFIHFSKKNIDLKGIGCEGVDWIYLAQD